MSSTVVELSHLRGTSEKENIYRLRAVLLLSLLLVLCFGIELFSQAAYRHMARKQAVEAEIAESLAIPPANSGKMQVLFAGNSLIQEGTDKKALQQGMGENFQVHRAGVPGSSYDDWYYGFRSLLAHGSKPKIIVFGISPAQLLQERPATLLPATRLWNTRATLSYYIQRHRKLTEISNLLIARYSTFFYLREQFRTDVRGKFPGFERLANRWMVRVPYQQPKTTDEQKLLSAIREKLEDLRKECEMQNVHLIYLIVPTHQADDTLLEPLVKIAATEAGVSVIEPIGENEWALDQYSDGYHLTHTAAIRFSELVGKEIADRSASIRRVNNSGA